MSPQVREAEKVEGQQAATLATAASAHLWAVESWLPAAHREQLFAAARLRVRPSAETVYVGASLDLY